jgi:phage shock protein A
VIDDVLGAICVQMEKFTQRQLTSTKSAALKCARRVSKLDVAMSTFRKRMQEVCETLRCRKSLVTQLVGTARPEIRAGAAAEFNRHRDKVEPLTSPTSAERLNLTSDSLVSIVGKNFC